MMKQAGSIMHQDLLLQQVFWKAAIRHGWYQLFLSRKSKEPARHGGTGKASYMPEFSHESSVWLETTEHILKILVNEAACNEMYV